MRWRPPTPSTTSIHVTRRFVKGDITRYGPSLPEPVLALRMPATRTSFGFQSRTGQPVSPYRLQVWTASHSDGCAAAGCNPHLASSPDGRYVVATGNQDQIVDAATGPTRASEVGRRNLDPTALLTSPPAGPDHPHTDRQGARGTSPSTAWSQAVGVTRVSPRPTEEARDSTLLEPLSGRCERHSST
jgi:hypothetical protein